MEHQAGAEGELGATGQRPVRQPEGEQLETGGAEEKVPVLPAQLAPARDALAEPVDHINAGGENVVELGDPGRLQRDQPALALLLLLSQLSILQSKSDCAESSDA